MVRLIFHVESVNRRIVSWWVDSPDVPGLLVVAPRIGECRRAALVALSDAKIGDRPVCLVLAER